ncbi:FecCD family ABC transporter permease [Amycolatopsis cihanbeyliensis]|uniref:Iron complex transport system permease protein n=1 Tax=Amycolatopsis cihanbeyliensis TaxID=1128664 RepID=A0A542DKU5_AMYCI|nr:iron chelate uptake ABC transporter family permease subunit [Amycolatopsis cihanbeyliensis]TQJ03722.1 iron complex transport system permease protein [Amycolatopsis cihanbeyliensis]
MNRRTDLRIGTRPIVVVGCLVLVTVVLVVLSIGTGDYALTPAEVLRTLAGRGGRFDYLVVTEQRLPRVLVAVLVGVALALAGTVFQVLTRNPLGSPDIIGFTAGSATGGVVTILVLGAGAGAVSLGALGGGLGTALLVSLLCGRRGLLGDKLVLIGIGVSTVLVGLNSYLLTRVTIGDAAQATTWMVGNLAGRGWDHLLPLAIAVVLLAPAVFCYGRPLRMLEMGDPLAVGIGVDVDRVRPLLFGLAVALTAVATASAGPVPFVALAAPQLARRLTRLPGPNLLPSAVMGAALMVAADYLGQRLLESSLLPVGVVTAALGGGYLAWLLLLQRRPRRP